VRLALDGAFVAEAITVSKRQTSGVSAAKVNELQPARIGRLSIVTNGVKGELGWW
jgi:hypothetical protein